MTAAELSKALVSAIRDVNDKKNLRLNQRYFDEAGTTNPQEKQLIELLNQKLSEDKDFKLPDGFKKVQDYEIEKDFVSNPKWTESKRIASEVLDELMMGQLGIHALEARPVKVPITRVVVDQNAPFKSPRRPPVIKGRQSTSAMRVN